MQPRKRNTDLWALRGFMEEAELVLGLRGSRFEGNYRIWMCGCGGKMATSGRRFTLGKGKGERA